MQKYHQQIIIIFEEGWMKQNKNNSNSQNEEPNIKNIKGDSWKQN